MACYSLEQHFEYMCNQHPQFKVLYAQWCFDKELLDKALQSIVSTFPHYSRHDASHSRQILVNIERILGERVKLLGATDTWLLLEAAYCHDLGMVIPHSQMQTDIQMPAFQSFLTDIIEDKSNELSSFAESWREEQAILPVGKEAPDFMQKYTQLMAEWFRRKHHKNSADIVRAPFSSIGLSSPRNELLPKRLFDILAGICQAHGENFSNVLRLPKAEAGLGVEDCHPKYVACLLRMGDLLDIDDNRFCPVMRCICGDSFPKLSQTHLEKHYSVKHFRLDTERIEIRCECPNPEAYEVTSDWFNWLKNEYHEQTQHWTDIVPSIKLGRLPTLVTPVVELKEPYLMVEHGKKPMLNINRDAMFNIVRSNGLYDSQYDCIRELLQNAVDATLHRIWKHHKERIKKLNPSSADLLSIYEDYKIKVCIEEDKEQKEVWNLTIKDKGIGITQEELAYVLEVAGSKKNKEKQQRLNEMPMWFRPSGAFGIGLQSVFMLVDEFVMFTTAENTPQTLKVHFHRNNGVIIEKLSETRDVGTEVVLPITIARIPKVLHNIYSRGVGEKLSMYDPTKKEARLDIAVVAAIEGYIDQFFRFSPIPRDDARENTTKSPNVWFDADTQIILRDISCRGASFRNEFLFRGQPFSSFSVSTYFVRCAIDFYHTTAEQFLTFNRSKILESAANQAYALVCSTLVRYIKEHFDSLSENKPYFAFDYFLLLAKEERRVFDSKFREALDGLLINLMVDGEFISMSFSEVIHNIKTRQFSVLCAGHRTAYDKEDLQEQMANLPYAIILDLVGVDLLKVIVELSAQEKVTYTVDKGITLKTKVGVNEKLSVVKFYPEDNMPLSKELLKEKISAHREFSSRSSCRLICPSWGDFACLTIDDSNMWVEMCYERLVNTDDYLMLPLNFNYGENKEGFFDNTDGFIDWVFEHRKLKNVSKEEIRTANSKLITFLKEEVLAIETRQ